MKRIMFILIAVVITVVNTACGDQPTSTPAPQPTHTARQTIIPDTTRVFDAATRTALSIYDPASGTLRFSQRTPVLPAPSGPRGPRSITFADTERLRTGRQWGQ